MRLLRQPKLVPTPSGARTSTPLMFLDITAPQLRALRTQRRRATTNTRAASCARGATSLSEHKTETPAAAHAGAGNRRGTKVGLARHLRGAEGGCGRECRRCTRRCCVTANGGCAKGGRLPKVFLCERRAASKLWALRCLELSFSHAQELSLAHDKAIEVVEVGHDGLLIEYGFEDMVVLVNVEVGTVSEQAE
jgi:hypothetical protein